MAYDNWKSEEINFVIINVYVISFQQKDISVCCYNPGHIMKTEDMKKHEEICRFTSRGVPKAEALVNESILTHLISLIM